MVAGGAETAVDGVMERGLRQGRMGWKGGIFSGGMMSLIKKLGHRYNTLRKDNEVPAKSSIQPGEMKQPKQKKNDPTDIYILVHGLGGRPGDLSYLQRCLKRQNPTAIVHLARCNSASPLMTFDGVRKGGQRLSEEIKTLVASYPSLTRISLVGNSLGGIYCRYAMGLLYDHRKGRIAGLKPHKFLTTATPHLGVGIYGYMGAIPPFLQKFAAQTLVGTTIRELLLLDDDKSPLLAQLSGVSVSPGSLPFMKALASFKERCAYANAVNDFMVAYKTAHPSGPLDSGQNLGSEIGSDIGSDIGSGIVSRKFLPGSERGGNMSVGSHLIKDRRHLMHVMSRSLTSLPWHQVTVEFPGPLPLAHNKICALERDPLQTWLNSGGRPVVEDQAKWLADAHDC
ncbi:hypothetical protein AAMO2058_001756500 [Amorphochlora amoebiformis]